jgi:hypothetical protein
MASGSRIQHELRPAQPRGGEAVELARLVDERIALQAKLDALDGEQRAASEAVTELSSALTQLERAAAGGESVSQAQRSQLEQELAAGRAKQAEPWAERRAGLEAALRDAERAIQIFTGENFDALYAEVASDAEAAAEAVDRAANAFLGAFYERMAAERKVTALVSVVRPMRPGDIDATRAEQAVREVSRLLDSGGEAAPLLRHDPRAPRHGGPIPEASERDPLPA